MRNLGLVLAIMLVSGSALACGAGDRPLNLDETTTVEAVDFEAITWRLEAYLAEAGEMRPALADTTVDLSFSGGEMGGSAGCNRYFAAYSVSDGDRLAMGPELGSTQMACSPEVMAQEQRYLALLGDVTGVKRDRDRLALMNDEGQAILEYLAVAPATLEGVEWQATGINNGKGGVVSAATTSMSTAVFAAGKVSGQAGCNRFNATYEIEGDRITFRPAMSSKMFCAEPQGIMDQEQQYLEAMARARTYRLSEQTLQLRDESGSLQVSFQIASQ